MSSLESTPGVFPSINTDRVQKIADDVAPRAMRMMAREDYILGHQLQVGQHMHNAMLAEGFSPKSREVWIASLAGTLHDIGKYHPTMVARATAQDAWTPESRKAFSEDHSAFGGTFIEQIPNLDPGNTGAGFIIAQVTRRHHSQIPEGYAYDTNLSITQRDMWGYVDLLQVFDKAEAVGGGKRGYVRRREGPMTPERVMAIAVGDRQQKLPPVIGGVAINVEAHLEGLMKMTRQHDS